MRKLILIKHARPQVDPAVPSERWELSEEGRARSRTLAERIAPHQPAIIIASTEPKATQTARIVADVLGIPFRTAPGLHEHDRTDVPHMPSREFISWMALLFQKPAERILGRESADEALARFDRAVEDAISAAGDASIAIVTHGTVLALYAAAHAQADAFQLWRRMALPSFIILSWPQRLPLETVESLE